MSHGNSADRLLIVCALALTGCSNVELPVSLPLEQRISDTEHVVPAYGGRLLGADRGEFGGFLAFEDASGGLHLLLDENVHGIAPHGDRFFVFTGLAHGDASNGDIHVVSQGRDGMPAVSHLGYLPGAPSQVRIQEDGSANFLVYEGWRGKERHFRCYALKDGAVVSSNGCEPPEY
jgi:hypothetical protein